MKEWQAQILGFGPRISRKTVLPIRFLRLQELAFVSSRLILLNHAILSLYIIKIGDVLSKRFAMEGELNAKLWGSLYLQIRITQFKVDPIIKTARGLN